MPPGERTGAYRTALNDLVIDDDGDSHDSADDYAVALLDETATLRANCATLQRQVAVQRVAVVAQPRLQPAQVRLSDQQAAGGLHRDRNRVHFGVAVLGEQVHQDARRCPVSSSALGYVPPDEYEQAYWARLEQVPQTA
ncbi:hypothetical protein [Streptomyces sp. NPDC005181]|uniref:hypothetical protein n=1 Tax=Streptomyces sp. NPDC005181 TaxID=3156869 RepID=UPI0033A80C05